MHEAKGKGHQGAGYRSSTLTYAMTVMTLKTSLQNRDRSNICCSKASLIRTAYALRWMRYSSAPSISSRTCTQLSKVPCQRHHPSCFSTQYLISEQHRLPTNRRVPSPIFAVTYQGTCSQTRDRRNATNDIVRRLCPDLLPDLPHGF